MRKLRISSILLLLAALLFETLSLGCGGPSGGREPPELESGPPAASVPNSYLFCFWNVENLFDDHLDNRDHKADREYDSWFAKDSTALQLKLDHLSDALIRLNEGIGPDILAIAEGESLRAAELLQDALNRRLTDPSLHYTHVLMKELNTGRHVCPAIITRLPVKSDRTRLHGSRLRILEGHIEVNGHDLVVIVSHWTSRITDKQGELRAKYGDQIYGTFRGMYKSNPSVDLLICGDFNDTPDSPSVATHLHATGDMQAALHPPGAPLLFNLFAGRDPEAGWGTHYHARTWYIFDEMVVSPGLLDENGWSCDPASIQTVNTLFHPGDKRRRPWRFGSERDKGPRGYSDHFPVTVRLKVI
jgi:endonuclease/exonuclease/phosphatase family metal-dependent hydrolase